MPDILVMRSQEEQKDFSQNFLISRPQYLGDVIFPDQKTEHFKAEYTRLSAGAQLPVMAYVHALDTEAHIGSRPAMEQVKVEKLLIKEKINQSESQQAALDSGISDDDKLVDFVYDDWSRLAERVRTRTEVAKMALLSSGKMPIDENGVKLTLDFGVPTPNMAFNVDLSDSSKDALGQIEAVVEAARNKGFTISGMVTSSAVLTKLKTNAGVSKAIYGGAGAGAMVSRSQLAGLFDEQYGFSDIRTNDLRYGIEGKNGKVIPTRFYPQDKISFMASYNGMQNFGVGLWGVTPEERKQGPWTAKSAQQFITLTQWEEPDPVAVWSKASGLFIPVLPNPDGLFIATVKLNAA